MYIFVHTQKPSRLIDYQKHIHYILSSGERALLITDDEEALNHYPGGAVRLAGVGSMGLVKYISILFCLIKVILSTKGSCYVTICYSLGVSVYALVLKLLRVINLWNGLIAYDLRSGSLSRKWYRLINFLFVLESRFFDFTFVVSDSLKSWLFSGCRKVFVIGLGADKVPAVDSTISSKGHYVLGYCGTFALREIASFFVNQTLYNEVRYVFVGDGDSRFEADVRELFSSKGLEENVSFLGRLSHEKSMEAIAGFDVCLSVLPDVEFYSCQPPTKIYEYMLAGKPVITSRHKESLNMMDRESYPYLMASGGCFFKDIEELKMLCASDTALTQTSVESISWSRQTERLIGLFNS